MAYLLDTNILSDVIRRAQGRIADRIRAVGDSNVITSIIVAAEIRYGAAKRESPRLIRQIEAVFGAFDVLPIEPPADAVYGRLRAYLERAGQQIGGNDLLIAAQAVAQQHVVVTNNVREFARIHELRCENWLIVR